MTAPAVVEELGLAGPAREQRPVVEDLQGVQRPVAEVAERPADPALPREALLVAESVLLRGRRTACDQDVVPDGSGAA
jgi:hypothetical protein